MRYRRDRAARRTGDFLDRHPLCPTRPTRSTRSIRCIIYRHLLSLSLILRFAKCFANQSLAAPSRTDEYVYMEFPFRIRLLLPCLLLLPALTPHALASFEEVQALFQSYCVECHGHAEAKSGVNLQRFDSEEAYLSEADLLDMMLWAIEEEEMPPRGSPQWLPEERLLAMQWLEKNLQLLRNANPNDPGFVVMSRLNMNQYEALIHDFTGVPIEVRSLLTPDSPAGEGFLNVGEAQSMSTAHFEGYLNAAKQVLRHATISPTHLLWHEAPNAEINDPSAFRNDRIERINSWFTREITDQLRHHQNALHDTVGMFFGAYLEAAWIYQHRDALGIPDATFASIAADYPVPLYPDSLQRLYAILTRDSSIHPAAEDKPDNLILHRLAAEWHALPAPDRSDPFSARSSIQSLAERYYQWINIGESIYVVGRRGFDRIPTRAEAEARARFRADSLKGIRHFNLDLTRANSRTLHFVAGDGGDGNSGDRVEWRNGLVRMTDGSELPWHEALTDWKSQDNSPLPRSPDGVITVTPPFWFSAVLPENATDLILEAAIPTGYEETATVQAVVTPQPPAKVVDAYGWIAGELPLGLDGHLTIDGQALLAGPQALFLHLRDAARAVSTSLRYVNVGDRTVHARMDEATASLLGVPWPQFETRDPSVFFALHPDDIIAQASPSALDEYQALQAQLHAAGQPLQQRAAQLLSDHFQTPWTEGHLPDPSQIAALPADLREAVNAAKAERDAEDALFPPMLSTFASRLWRRPALLEEIDSHYLPLFQQARQQGAPFESAAKQSLLAVLVAPPFLYQIRPIPGTDEELVPIDSHALASNLALALWSSLPDDALLADAASGALHNPEILAAHAQRMLADPRARHFVSEFAGFWLGFSGFDSFDAPDANRFPAFTNRLRDAMFQETSLFLLALFQENKPLTDLIHADYTYLNEPLARHYDIPGVEGTEMRKVALEDPRRGGILGMGTFLTRFSNPLRTSPVNRGAWILEQIIGEHLPPPPPNIPLISDDERNEEGLSTREQLELHRSNPACFSCHDRLDPLGIALENYDAIGRWRTEDLSGTPIDATGIFLSSNRTITGIDGVRDAITARQTQFLTNFSRKLLGYLIGRRVTVTDQPLIEEMVAALEVNENRPAAALAVAVQSPQFRFHRIKSSKPTTASLAP